MRFLDAKIDPSSSWDGFFTFEVENILTKVEGKLSGRTNKFTPQPKFMLRFLQVDINKTQVIILGQDPYPKKGVATGRAFEVGNISKWTQSFSQVSLKNIIRAVHLACTGNLISFQGLKEELNKGDFKILPPDKIFDHWEGEGVLCLNTSYSCEINKPGSHSQIWSPFAVKVMEFLSKKQNIHWFVWGKHAAAMTGEMRISHRLEAPHPGRAFTDDHPFFTKNSFERCEKNIDWTGYGC